MKQVVIQFQMVDFQDVDPLGLRHSLEEKLDGALQRNSAGENYIDGGDIGKDEMNIFAFVKTWERPIQVIIEVLKLNGYLAFATIAKRMKDDSYLVVWPKNYTGEFTIT